MNMEEFGKNQPKYVPSELVNCSSNTCNPTYHCYLIELKQDFEYDLSVHDILLALRNELDSEVTGTPFPFELCVDGGNLFVNLRHVGTIDLSPDQVQNCRRFQTTLFRILLNREVNKLTSVTDDFSLGENAEIDYLLLPAILKDQRSSNSIIDWKSISSVPFSSESTCECKDRTHNVRTKNGIVCSCKLKNAVVSTPHNGTIYINGVMELNGNSGQQHQKGKGDTTGKKDFKIDPKIELQNDHKSLLRGRGGVFNVKNYLQKGSRKKLEGPSIDYPCHFPPKLCDIIMSPIAINTIYSFSFIPSIMHRVESLLVACNLKKMLLDHCVHNVVPICKVLEAITTKECQEAIDYDSLETLGDSFLKYSTTQHLFKTHQYLSEGPLTEKRKQLISNDALFKYGCRRSLPGFIRKGIFEPQQWLIPGDKSENNSLKEVSVSSGIRAYVCRTREMKQRVVADVVEALIGAFLSTGDEEAALSFINWIGIEVDTIIIPYERHLSFVAEKRVNHLESLLKYSFKDASLLVEALTHGSCSGTEFPKAFNYQRLEFLGDAVLDYVITKYFYDKYPVDLLSAKFLTNMRSISVNNECYALSAIKAKLNEHVFCDSGVKKQIAATMKGVEKLSLESSFGWELETYFSQVLADVIESIAGAIFVDSGYKKEVVFQIIRPLLEPLVTPETAKRHPIQELTELCQKEHYEMKETPIPDPHDKDVTSVTIQVKVDGNTYELTKKAANKDLARKVASKEVLKLLMKEDSQPVFPRG